MAVALAGPLGAVIADKVPRRTFMITIDLIRATLVTAAAVIVATDGPAAAVYVIGVVAAMVGAPFRPAQAGLIPRLVNRPDELTASNAVASNLENVAVFAGPALGAILVGTTEIWVVFLVNVATFLWSATLVATIRMPGTTPDEPGSATDDIEGPDGADEDDAPSGGFGRELIFGFTTVWRDRDLRVTSVLAGAQGFVWGNLSVFMIIIAVDLLRTGPQGVGFLDAVMGVATVVGGAVVLTRVGKGRLGQDMAIGVLGWSLPMILMATYPSPVVIIGALVLIGLSDPWVNLGLETIPQRLAPEQAISRVYGAVESFLIGSMALGAAIAPFLIHTLGFRQSVAAVGIVVAAYTVSILGRMRRLDGRLTEPEHFRLLRSIGIFAPLSAPTLEALARKVERLTLPAGTVVVTEGEESDRFYVIVSGSVEVTAAGETVRNEGPGDFFGEIGLVRDVPRTATVTTVEPTELICLDRDDFLGAVSGTGESRRAADEIVARRLSV
ncbi:MFS transporter [Knoellia subterranea]|uniref:Cyclic nucleotide-binding domain-containing protein n=1 Tax=Knoellia subterranea KCTC 19937 TaxID=1385521 RepID=A0A0A0JU62_9MICO|nr:MFS transporter [Knoellia subterranea]KGN39607.1 hypothetical protein N803_02155 [Knoellia subterranea KCTC 19937]